MMSDPGCGESQVRSLDEQMDALNGSPSKKFPFFSCHYAQAHAYISSRFCLSTPSSTPPGLNVFFFFLGDTRMSMWS